MKKIILSVLALVIFAGSAFSQDYDSQSKWKNVGVFTLNYFQTHISSDWTGRERNSNLWQLGIFLSVERQTSDFNWANIFNGRYGKITSDGTSSSLADIFEFNSVFTYKIYRYLRPYASFYLRTQNNKFGDPITYMESAGLSWELFDNFFNSLNIRTGAALKQVNSSAAGDLRAQGAEAVINYNFQYISLIRFVSEARIFESFDYGADLSWTNKIYLKTGPWFTTEFGYIVYYDKSRIPAHVWPRDIETLAYVAIGVSFNLF